MVATGSWIPAFAGMTSWILDRRFLKRSCLNWLTRLLLVCAAGIACSALAQADPASTLRDKYAALADQLRQNQFKRPLVLNSAETQNSLQGDIYAIVDYPFSAVKDGLNNPQHWCEVMILHINTKYCHAAEGATDTILSINLGKKTYEELADTSRVKFDYHLAAATP
ncbi:MAG: hypothetical protein NTY41_12335, partial [Proteobacteria bacterium]|nr:hypothetical protein [Pseudomonadota bacterium]